MSSALQRALLLALAGCAFDPAGLAPSADGAAGDGGAADGLPAADVPPLALAFVFAPQTLMAGTCSEATPIESRNGDGSAHVVAAATDVQLAAAPAAGLGFFADAGCTQAVSSITLAAGTATASFYFRAESGGPVTLRAAAPDHADATQTETILPVVQRGTCAIAVGVTRADCAVPVPLFDRARSFLVFQAMSSDATPASSNVRCVLADTSTVRCERSGTAGEVQIWWQTVSLPGITVEHLEPACAGPLTTVLITPVERRGETFLLLSVQREGVSQSADDFRTARLVGDDTVEIEYAAGECGGAATALQVVQVPGARVTRGVTGSLTGASLTEGGLPSVNAERTFLLYGYRVSPGGPAICERVVRGRIAGPTSIAFSRGDGNPACAAQAVDAIAWERIELPAGSTVQQIEPALGVGVGLLQAAITPVDPTRAFVLAGGQWTAGQGIGESSYAAAEVIGTAVGGHLLAGPDRVQVERADTNGSARWTSFVVQPAL